MAIFNSYVSLPEGISQVLHTHGTSHDYKSKNGAVPFIFQLNPWRNACHRLTASAFVTSVAGGFVVFPKSTVGYLLIYWNLEKSWENFREIQIHHFGWIFSKSSILGNPPCVVLFLGHHSRLWQFENSSHEPTKMGPYAIYQFTVGTIISMDWCKGKSKPETIDFPIKYGAFL